MVMVRSFQWLPFALRIKSKCLDVPHQPLMMSSLPNFPASPLVDAPLPQPLYTYTHLKILSICSGSSCSWNTFFSTHLVCVINSCVSLKAGLRPYPLPSLWPSLPPRLPLSKGLLSGAVIAPCASFDLWSISYCLGMWAYRLYFPLD